MKKSNEKTIGAKGTKAILVSNKREIKELFSASRKETSAAQKTSAKLRKNLQKAAKELQSQDKSGNFEIQQLMSAYNQAETLASSVLKKRDDTANAIIGKI